MKSNITKMITMCMCMMVVSFVSANEKTNPDQAKIDYYGLESHNG